VRLMASTFHRPVTIGSPVEHTVVHLARIVRMLTGTSAQVAVRPLPADDPRQRRPEVGLARSVLEWEPRVPVELGIANTIASVRQELGPGRANADGKVDAAVPAASHSEPIVHPVAMSADGDTLHHGSDTRIANDDRSNGTKRRSTLPPSSAVIGAWIGTAGEKPGCMERCLAKLRTHAGDRTLVVAGAGLDSRLNGEAVPAEAPDSRGEDGLRRHERVFLGECLATLRAVRQASTAVPCPAKQPEPRVSVDACRHSGSRAIRDTRESLRPLQDTEYAVRRNWPRTSHPVAPTIR
jgi:hypothetical protein